MISYSDFEKIDVRVGKIIDASDFPEAKKPAYQLVIDLGELGVKNSSAQVTQYDKKQLIGKLVLCVVNFPPKKIAHFTSEVLTLGVPDGNGNWTLIAPESDVPVGGRLQ